MSFLLLFKSVLLIICTSKIWQYAAICDILLIRGFFLRNRCARVALLYLRGSGHALSPILFKFLLWTHLVVKRQNTLMFVTGVNRCHVNLVNNEKKNKKKTYQLWTYKKGLPTNAIYHRHEKTFVLLSIFIKWRKIDGASQYFLNFPVIFFLHI